MSVNSKLFLVAPLALLCAAHAQDRAFVPPFSSISAAPSVASEPEMSVEALIELALRTNPQLPIARENLEAARQRAAGARALLSPTVQAVPRIIGDREAADSEIIVSQSLDVFGKRRSQAQVLAADVRGAQAQTVLAERGLTVQVKNAAADLFAAQEAENLSASQVEVATLFRAAAARRASVGDVPEVQVQRADLELARVRIELSSARAERLVRRAALNQLVGQAPQTPLRVALSNDFVGALQVPSARLDSTPRDAARTGLLENAPNPDSGALASENSVSASSQVGSDLVAQRASLLPGALLRPDIASAQATLESRQAQVRAIGRQRLPDIELQLRRGSFLGQGASSTALRAVITVPIFDFGAISREKKAAQAQVRGQEAQLALLRGQVAAQVEGALIRLEQQRQTVAQYRNVIVPQTLDLLRKTQIGYAQGASTYLEVLDAQRTLRQVQTEYLQALVGTRTGETALESALGAALPEAIAAGQNTLPDKSGAAPNVR